MYLKYDPNILLKQNNETLNVLIESKKLKFLKNKLRHSCDFEA